MSVSVPDECFKAMRDFKFSKTNARLAMILRIKNSLLENDPIIENFDLDSLKNQMPGHLPCFVLINYSYKADDGRLLKPYALLHSSPPGAPMKQLLIYSCSLNSVIQAADVQKVITIRDLDNLEEEWLKSELEKQR